MAQECKEEKRKAYVKVQARPAAAHRQDDQRGYGHGPVCSVLVLILRGRTASPFYAKGNLLVVALFFVLYIVFGRVYDAFLMSMQRISEIVYAQFLAAGVSDLIMYVVIWLLSKHLPNLLPGVAALAGQVLLSALWALLRAQVVFRHLPQAGDCHYL